MMMALLGIIVALGMLAGAIITIVLAIKAIWFGIQTVMSLW